MLLLVLERRDGRWKKKSYNDLGQAMYQHAEVGAVVRLLIGMEIAIALDTAIAERWFSLMALLKDKRRNRMNDDVLNKLMSVCCHMLRKHPCFKNYCQ